MVPRRRAQPRLEPLALPLPAGRVPVRGLHRGERRPRNRSEPEYELLDTGVVRRRPVLDRRGALRQGRPGRPADGGRRSPTPGPEPRRCTCCRPPGSATPGPGTRPRPGPCSRGRHGRHRAPRRQPRPSVRRTISSCSPDPGPDGAVPDAAVLRERNQHGAAVRRAAPITPVPEGRHQRSRRSAAPPRSTRTDRGTKCAFWYQVTVAPGRRPSCGCGCARRQAAQRRGADALGDDFDQVMAQRRAEADEFYAELTPRRRLAPTRPW